MTTIVLTAAMLLACVPASASVLTLNDNMTHDLNSAVAEDGVEVSNSTTVNLLSGGSIGYYLEALDTSTVNVSGGTIGDDLYAYDTSEVNVSGGSIGDELYAYSNSTVNVSGGSIGVDLVAHSNSTVNVSDGTIGEDLEARDSSEVTVSGGSIEEDLQTYDSSTVTVSGGSIAGYLYAVGNSEVNVSGGSIGDELWAENTSTVTIFGTGFNFGYGDYASGSDLDWVTLTGTLADGMDIDNLVKIYDSATVTLAAPATAVPEPSSIAMFGIGALGLFGYSRRRRQTPAAA